MFAVVCVGGGGACMNFNNTFLAQVRPHDQLAHAALVGVIAG